MSDLHTSSRKKGDTSHFSILWNLGAGKSYTNSKLHIKISYAD